MRFDSVLEAVRARVAARSSRVIDNLIKLIEIPTVNPPGENYRELVEHVREYLSSQGVDVEVLKIPEEYASRYPEYTPEYPRYVLTARVGSGREVLHFNGHYDVVPPGSGWTRNPFKPVVESGRLYGRGASDMKAGVASILEAMVVLAELDGMLEHSITLSLVPDEETTSMGTKYLVERGLVNAEFAVVAEPTELKHIDVGCKGGVWLTICVEGVQAHASRPWLGVNAFEKAVLVAYDILRELKPRVTSRASSAPFRDENSRRATMELGGYVKGGSKSNTVPAEFCFSIDRRLIPEETSEEALRELLAHVESAAKRHSAMFRVIVEDVEEPYVARGAEEFVDVLREVTREVTGQEPLVNVKTGFTEMALLGRAGIKAITFGPGNEEVAHATDEYVDIDQVVKAIEIFATLALAMK